MSTAYRFEEPIPFKKVIENLPAGITLVKPEKKDQILCLSDGKNFLGVGSVDNGKDIGMTRYAGNDVDGIVEALEEKFDMSILSEHDEGFDDEEDEEDEEDEDEDEEEEEEEEDEGE